jgi:hypothetical protein
MLSIRYRPPFWNITRNNGTLHEIKGLQGVLGCFAKTKKNIIMLSMTYKNKNDYYITGNKSAVYHGKVKSGTLEL